MSKPAYSSGLAFFAAAHFHRPKRLAKVVDIREDGCAGKSVDEVSGKCIHTSVGARKLY
jgi:hypothetical protein